MGIGYKAAMKNREKEQEIAEIKTEFANILNALILIIERMEKYGQRGIQKGRKEKE